jgi:hypothetical protein
MRSTVLVTGSQLHIGEMCDRLHPMVIKQGLPAPHDEIAEESLLGAMLLSPGAALTAVETINANDFYIPRNKRIFGGIAALIDQGIEPDPVTVSSQLNDADLLDDMVTMIAGTATPAYVMNYAMIVKKASASRHMIHRMDEAIQMLTSGADPYLESEDLERFLNHIEAGTISNDIISMTIDELIDSADESSDIIIPGLMHRDYRTLIVAPEGLGKSLLLRTIAMATAQGRHPFSHQKIRPMRTQVIDLENPREAILQTAPNYARMLQERDPDIYDAERMRFTRWPGGINIRRLSDRAELEREIAFHRPDMVCIGPIYKMFQKESGEQYEDAAEGVMRVLDHLRMKYKFALILEHHAAKGKPGERRELGPMGSQRWMAWPEVGLSLRPRKDDPTVLDIERFRGDRLSGVNWPNRIIRDRNWLIDGIYDGASR